MIRRLLLSIALVVAGLVVTGRMRTAADSRADTPLPSAQASPIGRTGPAAPAAAGPDFTRVAAQGVKEVANISSMTVVRTRQTPFPDDEFFRYFFGDSDMF